MKHYRLRAAWDLTEASVNIEVTPSMLAKSMFFYVQAAGHFHALPEYFTERENYNSILLVYTKAGNGLLRYRGKSYALSPGQAFLIDCNEYHYYETDKSRLWEIAWLHFNGGSSHSYAELILKNSGPVLLLKEDSIIPDMLEHILQLHRKRDTRSDILSSKGIVDMLTELMLAGFSKENRPDAPHAPSYILEAINTMERRCCERITLDQLAADFNVSKFHLTREFKKYTGYSPNEYLIHMRLSLAKDMLKYSALSIEEIAYQSGFNHVSFFIKTFRQKEDATPLEFRKQWRAGRDK